MNTCKYCTDLAKYPPKTKWGGWCCKNTFYQCPGYRKKLKDNNNSWNKGKKGLQIAWNKGTNNGSFKNKKHTEKTKRKISEKMKGNTNANHRGDRQSFYKNIRMDSSWEVLTAKYFDDNNINWKYNEFGYKLLDGRFYYPDFFIYNKNKLIKIIEVKGYFRENNKQKFESFFIAVSKFNCRIMG
jgi:hypothetical protein